jgi:HlyD family secretion protein/adhesin transport system membrane fusion protein
MNSIIPFDNHWNHRLVTWPIMLFMVVFLVWATLSEIDESVRGEGKVIPSGQTRIIQHLEGGIIANILVHEGQNVKKGEPLYLLSQAFFEADQKEKEMELLALEARELRLRAEIDDAKEPVFSKKLQERVPHIIKNEKELFFNSRNDFKQEVGALQDKSEKEQHRLNEMLHKIQNLQVELGIAKEKLSIQERLMKKGAASRNDYLRELSATQNIITQIESLKGSIPISEEEIQEAKKKLKSYVSKSHVTQLEELNRVRVQMNKLLEKDKASTDRETRRLIKSPVNGKINKLYFHTLGGIIKPGDKVAEITPIGESLSIEAQIKTSDRAMIWEGQKVSVEITAFDFSKYGMLEGTLVSISPDSFTDDRGASYYKIRVETSEVSFSENELILAGMAANLNILTGKKSILEYILKPLKDIKSQSLKEH